MPRPLLSRLAAACTALGWLALAVQPAAADPRPVPVHGRSHGYGHGYGHGGSPHAYRPSDCRAVYTYGRHGVNKVLVCDIPDGPRGRARGWDRHRHDHHDDRRRDHRGYDGRRYLQWQGTAPWHGGARPTGYARPAAAGCDLGLLPGLVGGVSGAVVGSRFGGGNGRVAATAAGTLIGALAGLGIGDSLERACIAVALERVPDGRTVRWQPGAGSALPGQVTPGATWQADDGRYCREFTADATVGGTAQPVHGRACRQPDGAWEIVS